MKKIDEHNYECNDFSQSLDELAREGAQRMLKAALKAGSRRTEVTMPERLNRNILNFFSPDTQLASYSFR